MRNNRAIINQIKSVSTKPGKLALVHCDCLMQLRGDMNALNQQLQIMF